MQTSKYLISSERDREWGLVVSTVGYEEIAPCESYPTRGHADGYYFNTDKGRRLDEYQMLYVTGGGGVFRSEHTGEQELKVGDVFVLFPGVWHTYHPNMLTGWSCYWIGFRGANMDEKLRAGFIRFDSPVFRVGYSTDLIRLYDEAMNVARVEAPFSQLLLAGIVNHVLGHVYTQSANRRTDDDKVNDIVLVQQAQSLIRQHLEDPFTIQQVAAELRMSYSRFRRLFKDLTGFSPSLYQSELRMERARQLLSNTEWPVKEIAYRLQFESADYFYTSFKRRAGMRPTEYREQFR
ncbi:MAG: helix-turn-helix domain-containing protein [Prevotella sp.]|nr:helix-turn-helix domain-containing protein [Prevotella sp.]